MNTFFNKIYVITCENFTERHSYVESHFKKFGIQYEFKSSLSTHNILERSPLTKSEASLLYGHLHCIIDSKLNKYDKILICEDDVEFVDDIHLGFEKFSSGLPNTWDFLHIGNQFWATKFLRRKFLKDNLYKFSWGTGSHCIGVNSTMYDVLIEKMNGSKVPVDFLYYGLYDKYTAYCPENFLANALSSQIKFGYSGEFSSQIDHSI